MRLTSQVRALEMRLELQPAGRAEADQPAKRPAGHSGLFYKMADLEDTQLIYSIQAIAESRLL